MKATGELEAADTRAVSRFEEDLGRGPVETRTYPAEDTVPVRLWNGITPAEITLVEVEDPTRGRDRGAGDRVHVE